MSKYQGSGVGEGGDFAAAAAERAKAIVAVVTLNALTYVHVGEVWVCMRVECGRV